MGYENKILQEIVLEEWNFFLEFCEVELFLEHIGSHSCTAKKKDCDTESLTQTTLTLRMHLSDSKFDVFVTLLWEIPVSFQLFFSFLNW